MDVERTIEFILQHQAKFSAEMEQLKERQKEFSAEMEQLRGGLEQLMQRHVELHNSVEALTVVARNQQGQITQVLSFSEFLSRKLADLVESQRQTDERLNALIKVVDDLVRRNGGRQ